MMISWKYFKKRPIALVPVMTLYAIFDEVHQSYVNPQSAHMYDVFIDVLGVSVAMFVYIKIQIKQDNLRIAGLS